MFRQVSKHVSAINQWKQRLFFEGASSHSWSVETSFFTSNITIDMYLFFLSSSLIGLKEINNIEQIQSQVDYREITFPLRIYLYIVHPAENFFRECKL